MIESSLHKLKREVKAIDLLARQKEREWDNLLRLRKAKEETFQRLRRKREVLLQQPTGEAVAAPPPASPAPPPPPPPLPLPPPPPPPPRPEEAAPVCSTPTSVSAMWALKQQQQHQLQQLQQRQRAASMSAGPAPRPVAVAPFSVRVRGPPSEPLRPTGGLGPHGQQYCEILAQVTQLKQQMTAPGELGGDAVPAHSSSLAKLLMEKKRQMEPGLLNEMLKPHMTVRPSVNGPLGRPGAPPASSTARGLPPPPPPPPPPSDVEAWDSHADDCAG
ncbi:histone-lysine N-methyltransferase 2B-like [Pollicipes pollicipes]|uniref:histone-lysine N-methyltransferase 2B-like n=1 Tax=Pollicipes pollicipes TaxID=41117 RepID=UPI0018849D1C|nr:histone-lysine N-methyltransferase 2B-like [Pollicipes pollicipes]